ncbi:hypothetical protein E3N88_39125 [Mikania micrantha]|uniref:Uncharacterized protein n=1 Tax=Mikania micrantha TaxID=192012 RepID=A0A5N6LVX7_9ASTR|nr:hypothetical protein E3N88_39125 [Mikania micrantha]
MVIMKTKGVIEQAISDHLCHARNNVDFPETLVMADLGCSSGPNTLLVGSIVINAVANTSFEMGLKAPDIQINLNDLPTNDFNSVFVALQELQQCSTNGQFMDVHAQPTCYFTWVPGSYFGRLFPMKSLNFVHSSYSLQWLSQTDFLRFLRCRSEEMMGGRRMVLTLSGRTTDDARDEERYQLWRPLAMALQDMVFEGLVEEEKFDSFNIPSYTASPMEIMSLVKMEGSFILEHLEIFYVNWEAWKREEKKDNDASELKQLTDDHGFGHDVSKAVRAGIESLVANHFGEAILDDVFKRYGQNIIATGPKETQKRVSITISLTRKM